MDKSVLDLYRLILTCKHIIINVKANGDFRAAEVAHPKNAGREYSSKMVFRRGNARMPTRQSPYISRIFLFHINTGLLSEPSTGDMRVAHLAASPTVSDNFRGTPTHSALLP